MAEEIELTPKQLADIEKYIKEKAALFGVSTKDLKISPNVVREMAKEIADGTYKAMQKSSKILSSDIGKAVANATKDQIRQNNSLIGKLNNMNWWLGQDKSGSGLQAIRTAEKISESFELATKGNILGGLKQLGSAIPAVAKLMGGPLSIAIQGLVTSLIAIDKHLTKLNREVLSTTGGLYSSYLNKTYTEKLSYSKTIEDLARNYHRQGEKEELMQAIQKNFAPSIAYSAKTGLPIIAASLANRTAFESIGIDKNYSDQLLFKLIRQRGMSAGAAAGSLNNLLKFATSEKRTGIYSDQEIIKKSDELYTMTRAYGTSMEWAAKYVNRFSKEIELGTIAMSDFASYNKGIREGDTGKLAGIGQLLVEHGQATGLNIPKEMLESSGNSLAMSWNFRKLAESGNKDLLKLLSSWLGMQTGNIAGSNEAAAMETLYSLVGPNLGFGKISQPQVEKIVKGGFKNLEGAYAVSGITQPIEDFNNYENLIKHYLDKTTGETTKITTALGQVTSDLHRLFTGAERIPVYIDGQQINSEITGADIKKWKETHVESVIPIVGPNKV